MRSSIVADKFFIIGCHAAAIDPNATLISMRGLGRVSNSDRSFGARLPACP